MAKVGFDVAQFLSPYGGDPLGGARMNQRAIEQSGQGIQDILATIAARQLQQKQFERQQALAEASLDQRAQTQAQLQAAREDAARRADTRLAMDAQKMQADLVKDRGAQDAAALQALLDPFRAGDMNALAAARARTEAQDPTLSVRLPTDPAASTAMAPAGELYTADQVFADDTLGKLLVSRGQDQLYSGDQAAVQAAEREVAQRMLDPLRSSAYAGAYEPALKMGEGTAGAGMAGKEAAEAAIKQANAEANRDAQMANAQASRGIQEARLGETREQHDEANQFRLHQAIQGVGNMVSTRMKVPDIQKDNALLGEIRLQLESGVPMAENQALKGLLMRYTGKAMSNAEAKQAESSAGQWTRLEKLYRQWAEGGSLPPDFKEQMADGLRAIERYNDIRLHKAGVAARDAMYSSTALPMDLDQMVKAGNQVYTGITGRSLSPEQLAAERDRLARLRGPQQPVLMPQGTPTNLGVTSGPVPKVNEVLGRPAPRAPANQDEAEADELLKLMEQVNAGP
jgi:hypothetical protein